MKKRKLRFIILGEKEKPYHPPHLRVMFRQVMVMVMETQMSSEGLV